MSRIRQRLTFANACSLLALFVALGGTSYAAVSIGTGDVRNNSLTTADLRNESVTGRDVKNGSLASRELSADAKRVLRGLRGATGPRGPVGPKGGAGAIGPRGFPGAPGPVQASYHSSTFAVEQGGNESGAASCPAGQSVLAGGASVSAGMGPDPNITSHPADGADADTAADDAWAARADSFVADARTITVHAVCAPVAP